MKHDYLNIILFALPVYQLIYFAIHVSIARKMSKARVWYGFFWIAASVAGILNMLLAWEMIEGGLSRQISSIVSLLLVPPLLLCFSAWSVLQLERQWKALLLFMPAIVLAIAYFGAFWMFGFGEENKVISINQQSFTLWQLFLRLFYFIAGLIVALQLVLLVFNLQKAFRHVRDIKDYVFKPNWLALLRRQKWISVQSAAVVVVLVAGLNFEVWKHTSGVVFYNIILLLLSGALGKVSQLFFDDPGIEKYMSYVFSLKDQDGGNHASLLVAGAENSSFISPEEINSIQQRLEVLMDQKKPYTDKKFALDDLCKLLNVSKRKLGFVINEVMHSNFYGLINEYRVRESIRLLESQDAEKYTIDTIAEMSGFQSKSSFYSAFRKHMNVTPGEYKMSRTDK